MYYGAGGICSKRYGYDVRECRTTGDIFVDIASLELAEDGNGNGDFRGNKAEKVKNFRPTIRQKYGIQKARKVREM